jgi:Dockerin type I domain
VDLDGHQVNYAGTRELSALHLGDGGSLEVRQGYLGTAALVTGASGGSITLDRSGQVECDGFAGSGRLVVDVREGRFRNRGQFSGLLTVDVSGGEAELAGGFDGHAGAMLFGAGSTLNIHGSDAEAGYFGENGAGHLGFLPGSRLAFEFDAQGISTITDLYGAGEVFSSFDADSSGQQGAMLHLDLSALASLTGLHEYLLIDVDELSGRFGTFQVLGMGAGGVSGARLTWDVLAGEARLVVDTDGSGGLSGFSIEAVELPGDANGDGVVSDADYTIWADHYGQTNASWSMGDFNGSGTVTEADYTIWADHYGSTTQGTVPEPTGLVTAAIVGLTLTSRRRRR